MSPDDTADTAGIPDPGIDAGALARSWGEEVERMRATRQEQGRTIQGDLTEEEIVRRLSHHRDGRVLALRERQQRDVRIYRLLKRGISPETVASQMQEQGFDLSPSMVRYIRSELRREQVALSDYQAVDVVQDTLDGYEAAIEELALIAAKQGVADSVKVNAIRVRLEAMRGRVEMLQGLGVVPHDLGQLRVVADVNDVARRIIDALDAHGVDEAVQAAVIDAVEGRELTPPPDADVVEAA